MCPRTLLVHIHQNFESLPILKRIASVSQLGLSHECIDIKLQWDTNHSVPYNTIHHREGSGHGAFEFVW